MIWFDGVSSESVSVFVESYPERIIPARKIDIVSVPGRNGDLIFPQDAYKNYDQEYEIYVSAKKTGLNNMANAVSFWLMKEGYRRLEDSYDPDVYRMAHYTGGINVENYLNEYGRATIKFNCMPQRWYKSGSYPIVMKQGVKLYNPSPYPSKPLIKVIGSGNGTVTVGETVISLKNIDGYLLIDSDMMHCYKETENCNSKMSGQFPIMGKETAITWDGGITSVIVTPRWYTI